mgnify:FL=1
MDTQTRYLWGIMAVFLLLSGVFAWSLIYKRTNTFAVGAAPEIAAIQQPPVLPAIRAQDPRIGSKRADALEVVEFADYRCSHCRVMAPTLLEIATDPANNIRLVWREAPSANPTRETLLPFAAARCANAQGQFAVLHQALFETAAYSEASLLSLAEEKGLDMARFSACLKDEGLFAAILRDQTIALESHIVAAPTLFVRGQPYVGTLTETQLAQILR